ncbi:hypothetical protein ABW19_dt0208098 [Dactylella cylindrospora]|nr:hypothetical protein ABW19_dt0208098 [Dactylella cylindrospora]
MFRFSLNGIIFDIRDYGTGEDKLLTQGIGITSSNTTLDPICTRNMIKVAAPNGYVTVSVYALLVVLVAGTFIVALSFVAEPLVSRVLRRSTKLRVHLKAIAWDKITCCSFLD